MLGCVDVQFFFVCTRDLATFCSKNMSIDCFFNLFIQVGKNLSLYDFLKKVIATLDLIDFIIEIVDIDNGFPNYINLNNLGYKTYILEIICHQVYATKSGGCTIYIPLTYCV